LEETIKNLSPEQKSQLTIFLKSNFDSFFFLSAHPNFCPKKINFLANHWTEDSFTGNLEKHTSFHGSSFLSYFFKF